MDWKRRSLLLLEMYGAYDAICLIHFSFASFTDPMDDSRTDFMRYLLKFTIRLKVDFILLRWLALHINEGKVIELVTADC